MLSTIKPKQPEKRLKWLKNNALKKKKKWKLPALELCKKKLLTVREKLTLYVPSEHLRKQNARLAGKN